MATENDSYCAVTDVEARTQIGTFETTTIPTEAQVVDFQAQRAGVLYSDLRSIMGTSAPGPASYSVTVDTSSDAGKALEFVLTKYNAIGAAIDALEAAGAGETPGRSERIADLYAMWQDRTTALEMAAKMYLGYASRSSTHISSGEITQATVVAREEDGLVFDGLTEW